MGHFAKVSPDNIVLEVIVAEQDYIDNKVETVPCKWIRTSYNTRNGIHYDPDTGEPSADQSKALRRNFAARGSLYLPHLDVFIFPKPHESWSLNQETGEWEAPIPKPNDGNDYEWDEENQLWEQVSEPE